MKVEIDRLKDLGFNLMPLSVKGKEPVPGVSWIKLQQERYTGDFPDQCNVAVICGYISNNLFVVDLDDATLMDDFAEYKDKTFIVESGKGYHIYFRAKGLLPKSKKVNDDKLRHIDVQSEGKYVVAPGSFVVPGEKDMYKYPLTRQNGYYYKIISDKPVMEIDFLVIKEKLEKLGFNLNSLSLDEVKEGVREGGRNDAGFKYACYLVREGVFGSALELEMEKWNEKNKPPLPKYEIENLIAQAHKYERRHIDNHVRDVKEWEEDNKQITVKMQNINPQIHEGKILQFDAMISAVGERRTYIKQAEYGCPACGNSVLLKCDY